MAPRILVLTSYYLPGYRAGGPVRTLANLVSALGSDYDFRIITRDRDLRQSKSYAGVRIGAWIHEHGSSIYYCRPASLKPNAMGRLLKATEHDALYLNSLFDPQFSILPLVLRALGRIPRRALVIAPRGECAPAALRLRRARKRVFLWTARLLGLHRGAVWHASSEMEAGDIRRVIGRNAMIAIAPDLPVNPTTLRSHVQRPAKQTGELEILFLARISPMKNLDFALRVLRHLTGRVRVRIIGPIDDEAYWRQCQALAAELPSNVSAEYLGPIAYELVERHLHSAQLLFLPSRGESFGHVLFEALAAGCPVLTSDRTIWRDLSRHGVGWDLPLKQPERFAGAIRTMLELDGAQFDAMSQRAAEFAATWYRTTSSIPQTRAVFAGCLASTSRDVHSASAARG
jgi:glycosyltransferase involved in cell wall biosynthesis